MFKLMIIEACGHCKPAAEALLATLPDSIFLDHAHLNAQGKKALAEEIIHRDVIGLSITPNPHLYDKNNLSY